MKILVKQLSTGCSATRVQNEYVDDYDYDLIINESEMPDCDPLMWVIEDGEMKIRSNANNEIIQTQKQKANDLYNSIENHFLIEANNRVYNFDISKKLDFFAKFMMQGEADFLDWDDYSNETVQHDKQMTANIIQSADTFLRALFNAKKADKLACESGDYSLINLNTIKAKQDRLRNVDQGPLSIILNNIIGDK